MLQYGQRPAQPTNQCVDIGQSTVQQRKTASLVALHAHAKEMGHRDGAPKWELKAAGLSASNMMAWLDDVRGINSDAGTLGWQERGCWLAIPTGPGIDPEEQKRPKLPFNYPKKMSLRPYT